MRPILGDHLAQVHLGFDLSAFPLCRVDGAGFHKLPCRIQGGTFTAGPQAGVNRDHLLLAHGGLQQQIAQVLRKDLHGRTVRLHLRLDADIDFNARLDQAFIAVFDRLLQEIGKG